MNGMRSQTPRVSVVIPTFNRAEIIPRTIESVLGQTFTDYEIIVVDDGSTDRTGEVLSRRYGDRIRYISKSINEGISAARNAGMEKARGTYIAVLDDDDLWLPDKLALQVELLERNQDVSLAYCGTLRVNDRHELLDEVKPEKRGHIFVDMLYRNCLMGPASVAMFPRALLSKSGLFDTGLSSCADWDMWIRLAQCGRVDFVDRPLVLYVIHESNMHSNIDGMAKDSFAILDKYLPMLSRGNGSEDLGKRIYSNHSIHFAWEYYKRNDLLQFRRLLHQAIDRDPTNRVGMYGEGLRGKEKAVLEILGAYWSKNSVEKTGPARRNAFSTHYAQLAWEYYHQGDIKNFRRCLISAGCHAFPRIPLRLAVAFFKSYLGKEMVESLHRARKRLQQAWH